MNQQQKKYLLNRVDSICFQKRKEAKEKYKLEVKTLDNVEKYDLLKKGKVPLQDVSKVTIYRSSSLDVFFDFSKFEQRNLYDLEKLNAADTKIIKEATKIKDKIMLGDLSEDFSELLTKLENLGV